MNKAKLEVGFEDVQAAELPVDEVGDGVVVDIDIVDLKGAGARAFYAYSKDYIQMPTKNLFKHSNDASAAEGYYATLFHELTHWTGNTSRLDREMTGYKYCDDYAMEEMIAELGAAYRCAKFTVTNTPRPNHAAYISEWLSDLKDDNRSLFNAAAKASKAAEYIVGFGMD